MKMLSLPEAADLLGVSRPTLRKYLARYQIRFVRLDGKILISEDELNRLITALEAAY